MGPFSVDEINKMTEQNLGYPVFGYWHFFNDGDAGKLMDENVYVHLSLILHTELTVSNRLRA